MSETDELQARITELEAERDRLQAKVAHLDKLADLYPISLGNACEERDKLKHSDRALRKEIAALRQEIEMLSGNPEAVHQGALAALSAIKQMTEMKAERDALKAELADSRAVSIGLLAKDLDSSAVARSENAALRKALEDAPHDADCSATCICPNTAAHACNCWKARIPQPTPQTLEQSLPDGKRAGNT